MTGSFRSRAGVASQPGIARADFKALGTTVTLLVDEPAALDQARRLLDAELAAIDHACSRFRADSELSAVNRAAGRPVRIGALLMEALGVALDAAAATDGDVDPTCGGALIDLGYDRDFAEVVRGGPLPIVTARPIPGWRVVELDRAGSLARVPAGLVLDLGATAKALAADRAAAQIHAATGCGVLVNLGGDIALAGPAPEEGWRIRVAEAMSADGEDDADVKPGEPHLVVAITEGGLATSGTGVRSWRRGPKTVHHIISPATGEPAPTYWRTATVAGANCVAANTASTAAIVRGAAAVPWLDRLSMPAVLIRQDGSAAFTGGWPRPDATTG